ncbi:MAG: hypothetical protein WDN00_16950 [Limisphaerales bacterium]
MAGRIGAGRLILWNTSPVHSGSASASVTIATTSYDGLQIYHTDLDSTPYTNLNFWINGGTSGGQQLQVYGLLHVGTTVNAAALSVSLASLQANTWQHITLSLSSLGVANQANFTGFVIQSRIGAVQPVFYLDDISLISGTPTTPVTNGRSPSQSMRS